MCGIVGYTGKSEVLPILMDGLRRLEYRGYDSAGVAVITPDQTLSIRRAAGKLANLAKELDGSGPEGVVGIGHTRWATHGCLLYTSDAADDLLCVDLGGRRIIKKKTT